MVVYYTSPDREYFPQGLNISTKKSGTEGEQNSPMKEPSKTTANVEGPIKVLSTTACQSSSQSIPIEDFDAMSKDDPVLAFEQLLSGQVFQLVQVEAKNHPSRPKTLVP